MMQDLTVRRPYEIGMSWESEIVREENDSRYKKKRSLTQYVQMKVAKIKAMFN
jgi:hypothetical protein